MFFDAGLALLLLAADPGPVAANPAPAPTIPKLIGVEINDVPYNQGPSVRDYESNKLKITTTNMGMDTSVGIRSDQYVVTETGIKTATSTSVTIHFVMRFLAAGEVAGTTASVPINLSGVSGIVMNGTTVNTYDYPVTTAGVGVRTAAILFLDNHVIRLTSKSWVPASGGLPNRLRLGYTARPLAVGEANGIAFLPPHDEQRRAVGLASYQPAPQAGDLPLPQVPGKSAPLVWPAPTSPAPPPPPTGQLQILIRIPTDERGPFDVEVVGG